MPLQDTKNPVIYTNWNLVQQYGTTSQGTALTVYTETKPANTFINEPDTWFRTYRGGGTGNAGLGSNFDERAVLDVDGKRSVIMGGYAHGSLRESANVPRYFSSSFSGSSSYLYIPSNANLSLDTGDFTIEAWASLNSLPAQNSMYPICQNDSIGTSSSDKFIFGLFQASTAGNYFFGFRQHGGGNGITSSVGQWKPQDDHRSTWYHFVVVRQSGTMALWLNGIRQTLQQSNTSFSATSFGQNGLSIGGAGTMSTQATGPYYFNGNISNFRYTVGTALHSVSSNTITLPTAPYTLDNSNIKVLTCTTGFQSIRDESNSDFSITNNNNVSPSLVNPFNILPFLGYFPTNSIGDDILQKNGGSNLYAEDGGVLRALVAFDRSQNYGLGIGYAAYPESISNDNSTRPFLGFSYPTVPLNSSVTNPAATAILPLYVDRQQANTFINDPDTWFRTYRSGGNHGLVSTNDNRASFDIDGKRNIIYGGYFVSNTRSQVSGFEPIHPGNSILANTGGSAAYSQDRGVLRIQSTPSVIMVPPANIVVTQHPANTGSVSFTSGGSQLSVGGTWTLPSTTTPFTMECWVYPTNSFSGSAIATTAYAGSGAIPFVLGLNNGTTYSSGSAGSNPYLNYYNGSSWGSAVVSSTSISLNQWTHIAGVFDGTTASIYVNGIRTGTWTTSWITSGQANFYLGRRWDFAGNVYYNGLINNFRFVIGTAVYSGSSFTVPTRALDLIANTILLTAKVNNAYTDFSPSANIVSSSGTSLSSSSPFLSFSNTANDGITTVTVLDGTTFNANTPYILTQLYNSTGYDIGKFRNLMYAGPYSPLIITVDNTFNEIKIPKFAVKKINVETTANTFINDPDTWFRTYRGGGKGNQGVVSSTSNFSIDVDGKRNVVFAGVLGNSVSYLQNVSPLNTSGVIYGGEGGPTSLTIKVVDLAKFGPKSFGYGLEAVDIGHTGIGIPDGAGSVGTTVTETWS